MLAKLVTSNRSVLNYNKHLTQRTVLKILILKMGMLSHIKQPAKTRLIKSLILTAEQVYNCTIEAHGGRVRADTKKI